jgi:hypothetical protein
MGFRFGTDLSYKITAGSSQPVVFEPQVDWTRFTEPNIIHAYCQNSLFFWSEEHAREFRRSKRQVEGVYLTLEQSVYSTRIAQGALFAF